MRNVRQHILLVMLISAMNCRGGDQDFYRVFLSLVDTNSTRIVGIKSQLLVDTNNTALKLTNSVMNLEDAKANGQIGAIRLGMTMEQVVARWGKPYFLWSRCYGGPRFCYGGYASVIFDPGSNSVIRILWVQHEPPDSLRFGVGLSESSRAEDFARVLGVPSARHESPPTSNYTGSCRLIYNTPAATLRIGFIAGSLNSVIVERPSKEGGPEK